MLDNNRLIEYFLNRVERLEETLVQLNEQLVMSNKYIKELEDKIKNNR